MKNVAFAALALVVALVLSGCQEHLAGTHDAELVYEIYGDGSGHKPSAVRVAFDVKARLTAAQVTADVDSDGDRVSVKLDKDLAEFADELVHWRGGIAAYRVDAAFNFALADTADLEMKTEPGPAGSGTTERYYVGATADILRSVRAMKLAPGHLVFVERIDATHSRTRVVVDPPVVDLGPMDGIAYAATTDLGRSIAITLTPDGKTAFADAAQKYAGEKVALVRSHSLLETRAFESIAAAPLVLHFGTDIYSFTRAAAVKRVLVTPTLPVLRRMSGASLPPAWGAAIACIALPMLLSLAWLVFVRQFDRGRPEPWWLVLATFALGGLAVVPAAFAEWALQAISPYLNPSVMTLGGQLIGLAPALLVFTITVGVVEEGTKLLGAWVLAGNRREFDEPVDGIVYGCASALGFAAVENMKYFAGTRLSGAVVAYRAFLSVPAHMFFGAIWGYALGRKLVRKKTSLFAWFMLAALAHGLFDTLLSIDGVQLIAIVLDVGLGLVFIQLLRRSLRFGTVAQEHGDVPASSARATFRMGSAARFAVLAALVVLLAGAVMTLGTAYEILHHRVGVVFLAFASTILALFGVAAYFLTQAIPLDVAIDELGVTFAGATSRWRHVLGFETVVTKLLSRRAWVVLHTTEGVVRLGPCAPQTTEQLTTVLHGYMARAREAGEAPGPEAPPA